MGKKTRHQMLSSITGEAQFAKAQLHIDEANEFMLVAAYSMGINLALKTMLDSNDEIEKVTQEKIVPSIIAVIQQKTSALTGYDGGNVQNLAMNLVEQKCAKGWLINMATVLGVPDDVMEQITENLK